MKIYKIHNLLTLRIQFLDIFHSIFLHILHYLINLLNAYFRKINISQLNMVTFNNVIRMYVHTHTHARACARARARIAW